MPELRMEIAEYHGQPHECQALVLDNGAKITKLTATRELSVIFLYNDARSSFQFLASRWSEDLEALDTWTVFLGIALRNPVSSQAQQLTETELRDIKSNIAAALRAWPQRKLKAAVPLKGVLFRMTDWRNLPDQMIEF